MLFLFSVLLCPAVSRHEPPKSTPVLGCARDVVPVCLFRLTASDNLSHISHCREDIDMLFTNDVSKWMSDASMYVSVDSGATVMESATPFALRDQSHQCDEVIASILRNRTSNGLWSYPASRPVVRTSFRSVRVRSNGAIHSFSTLRITDSSFLSCQSQSFSRGEGLVIHSKVFSSDLHLFRMFITRISWMDCIVCLIVSLNCCRKIVRSLYDFQSFSEVFSQNPLFSFSRIIILSAHHNSECTVAFCQFHHPKKNFFQTFMMDNFRPQHVTLAVWTVSVVSAVYF